MELRRPTTGHLLTLLFALWALVSHVHVGGETLGLPESVFLTAALALLLSGVFVRGVLDSSYYTTLGGALIVAYSGYLLVSEGGAAPAGGVVVGLLFVVYGLVTPFTDTAESASERPR